MLANVFACGSTKVKAAVPRLFAPSCNCNVAVTAPLAPLLAVKLNVRAMAAPLRMTAP